MSKALYRKYRSKSLSEIVGQAHVTDILSRSLEKGIVAHAYLLTGPRGVGKTSIARILAHEINKLPYSEDAQHLDIIEIDAASNNSVEDIRDLRDKVQIAPVSASKKIYIIDEVHMLSKAAFNALLKTLEEPPEHVVFILATTDSDKLPQTIISRTQRFNFRSISTSDAAAHLKFIAKQEGISIDDEALELIALRGDGSFRDSIGILDQLQSSSNKKTEITRAMVEQSLGLMPIETVTDLLEACEDKNLAKIVELLDTAETKGIQPAILAAQLTQTVRKKMIEKPQLIPLLDQLITVERSPRPAIKLLVILATQSAIVKPKTAALTVAASKASTPLAELEKQATKPKPKLEPVVAPIEEVQVAKAPELPKKPASANIQKVIDDFDWNKLIQYTKANFVAVYSVLAKCQHAFDGDILIIYTGNAFYKKKLDDTKHRINLQKSLQEIGAGDLTVEMIASPPPPKDSTAAAVAAIMGGGEEVTVGE